MTVLNFCFCGTCTSAADNGVATNDAVKKFENTILLTGVGAPEKHDPESGIYYPTPGTFYRDKKGLRQKSYCRMSGAYAYAGKIIPRAGAIRGTGEKDNIDFALAEIDSFLKKQPLPVAPISINVAGFSRGGASAIRFANAIYQQYGNRFLMNLFVQDPNAGFGRHHSHRKTFIPPTVKNIHFSFSKDDHSVFLRSHGLSLYEFLGINTSISSIVLPGNHGDQEYQGADGNWPQAALVNRYLLEQFLLHYGAKKIENKRLNNPPIVDIESPLKHDERQLIGSSCHSENDSYTLMHTKYMPKKIDSAHKRLQWRLWQNIPELAELINAITDLQHGKLQYTSYTLACCLIQDIKKIHYDNSHKNYVSIIKITKAATKLISSLDIKKNNGHINCDTVKKNIAAFKKAANINISHNLRHAAGTLLGVATAIVIGMTAGAIYGFFSGLLRWKMGFIGGAIVGTFCGAAKGAQKTYRVTYRTIVGNSNKHNYLFYKKTSEQRDIHLCYHRLQTLREKMQ